VEADSIPHAGLVTENWERFLPKDDPMRDFIIEGVSRGFKLSQLDSKPKRKVLCKNYFSCYKYRNEVENQILTEIENGRYIFTQHQPSIVSSLGAIPKSDGGVRLIHDCSRPAGEAVNDSALKDDFKYQTLQDAMNMVSPGDYLAKVDLQSAYRSVRVSPEERDRLGISWTFQGALHPVYLLDTCLPFGHSRSCFIFNELSQSVVRIMRSYGYENVMAYLDDFLVSSGTFKECKEALDFLIFILRKLGFAIAYRVSQSRGSGPKPDLPRFSH